MSGSTWAQLIFVKVWLKILNANHCRDNDIETPPCSLKQSLDTRLLMAGSGRV